MLSGSDTGLYEGIGMRQIWEEKIYILDFSGETSREETTCKI
jgi:hypothetical protein